MIWSFPYRSRPIQLPVLTTARNSGQTMRGTTNHACGGLKVQRRFRKMGGKRPVISRHCNRGKSAIAAVRASPRDRPDAPRHGRSGSRTNNLKPAVRCTHLITAAPEKSPVQKGGQGVVRGLPTRRMRDILVESMEMWESSGQQRLTLFVRAQFAPPFLPTNLSGSAH